jgi:hypothetical protein
MKRHHMSKLEGEESMQRTNRIVLGLIAVFVLGGSLVLLSCGGGEIIPRTSPRRTPLSCWAIGSLPLAVSQTLM